MSAKTVLYIKKTKKEITDTEEKTLKKLSLFLAAILVFTLMLPVCVSAEEKYDFDAEFEIKAVDEKLSAFITLYPNDSDESRVIKASEYGFKPARLMIFDKDGKLIEVGENIYENVDGQKGSPQFSVTVPPKGFLISFGAAAPKALQKCYNTVVDGAMFYNSTIPVIYPVFGSYDKEKMTVRIAYNDEKPVSDNAKKFLFVGNSSTYFSGTPIQFKGMCDAAGIEIKADYCTFGAAALKEFADENHARGKKYRSMVKTNGYDYVVFQGEGGGEYEGLKAALDVLVPIAKENGAEPVLYMRYAGKTDGVYNFDASKKHHDNYTKLAEDFKIKCAPSADAFAKCSEDHPEINLHADDNGHHSKAGAYLVACTWFETFMGKSAIGNTYRPNIDEDTAKMLQKAAHKICSPDDEEPEESEKPGKPADTESKDENADGEDKENSVSPWIYVVIGVLVVILVIVIAAVITKKSKKDKKPEGENPDDKKSE